VAAPGEVRGKVTGPATAASTMGLEPLDSELGRSVRGLGVGV